MLSEGGTFLGSGGEISVVYFQEERTDSIALGRSLSLLWISVSFYIIFSRLPHYVAILVYFECKSSIFSLYSALSCTHTHAYTHKANIYTVVSVLMNYAARWPGVTSGKCLPFPPMGLCQHKGTKKGTE